MAWELTNERPGYLGSKRDKYFIELDKKYGPGRWRFVWMTPESITDFLGVCALYEDAYWYYLRTYDNLLEDLIAEAEDVYDDDPDNVSSGNNYLWQETSHTHIQDIAIRRAVLRTGKWFRGDKLIQIRENVGMHPLSRALSPGRVPFHMKSMIIEPQLLNDWTERDSVEAFYQSNRFVQVWRDDA